MENRIQLPRADCRVSEAVELMTDFGEYRLEGLGIRVGAAGGGELGVEIAQELFDGAGVDRRGRQLLKRLANAINTSRQIIERAWIDCRGSVRASDFLIEPRRDLFQTPLDRGERRWGRRAFDLPTSFLKKRGHLCGLEVGSGTCAELLDAVSQFADLALQPLKRRRAQRSRSEEVAHFFRLPPDQFKGFRLDSRRREVVDLGADRADLALEASNRRLRVMRF